MIFSIMGTIIIMGMIKDYQVIVRIKDNKLSYLEIIYIQFSFVVIVPLL